MASSVENDGNLVSLKSTSCGFAFAATVVFIIVQASAFGQGATCGRHEYHDHDEHRDDLIIHVCKCEPGFARTGEGGACIAIPCVQAFMRLRAAQEGARRAAQTAAWTYVGDFSGRLLQNIGKTLEAVHMGELWRAEEYLAALQDPNSGVDKFLSDLSAQPVKDDATWEAIKNLNNFRRLVKETRDLIHNRACDN